MAKRWLAFKGHEVNCRAAGSLGRHQRTRAGCGLPCVLASPTAEARQSNKNAYNHYRSAFWRLTRSVCRNDKDDWYSSVCYSNLYKISPHAGGNPWARLRKCQLEHCLELFQIEIAALKPKLLLVFAGEYWFAPFAERLGLELDSPKRKEFVQKVGYAHGAIWVVGKHPQRKPGSKYLKEILDVVAPIE